MTRDIVNLNDFFPGKIVSKQITNLTAPGDNYGSEMLQVNVVLDNGTTLNLAAKTLPPSKAMQEFFGCHITFPKEIYLYKTVVPLLTKIASEESINFLPKFYNSRLNLSNDSTKPIDEHAVFFLENLKTAGYRNLNKLVGYDYDGARIVLKLLAQFHSLSIVLKLNQPEVFSELIKQFGPLTMQSEIFDLWEKQYHHLINQVASLKPYLSKLQKVSVRIYPLPKAKEPFGTIVHNDCWVNNTMVLSQNGTITNVKLIDFQLIDYGSLARDVLFFIFSSIQNDVVRASSDDFLRYYHQNLVEILENHGVYSEDFSYLKFEKELAREARLSQFAHTVLMFFPIFGSESAEKDAGDLDPTDFRCEEISKEFEEKLILIVEEYAKRDWLPA